MRKFIVFIFKSLFVGVSLSAHSAQPIFEIKKFQCSNTRIYDVITRYTVIMYSHNFESHNKIEVTEPEIIAICESDQMSLSDLEDQSRDPTDETVASLIKERCRKQSREYLDCESELKKGYRY